MIQSAFQVMVLFAWKWKTPKLFSNNMIPHKRELEKTTLTQPNAKEAATQG